MRRVAHFGDRKSEFFRDRGTNHRYQISGWYKVSRGPEEIEDKRTYDAKDRREALTMAVGDGLSRLTFVSEIIQKGGDTIITAEHIINI